MTKEKLGPFPREVALGEKRPPAHTPSSAERQTPPHEEIKTDIGKPKAGQESHRPLKPL